MLIHKTLPTLCQERGWSMSKLAKASGVSVKTIHGWTLGRRGANLVQLQRVAIALEVSIHELCFGCVDPHHTISTRTLEKLFTGDVRVTIHKIRGENDEDP